MQGRAHVTVAGKGKSLGTTGDGSATRRVMTVSRRFYLRPRTDDGETSGFLASAGRATA